MSPLPNKNPRHERKPMVDKDPVGLDCVGAHGNRPASPDELEEIIRRQVSKVSTANAGAHEVWVPRFLAALERTPNWSLAARVAGVHPSTPHKRAGVDPEFAAAAALAERSALDLIEAAAFKSAVYGDLEPVFHEGVKVGEVVRYSDRMREMLLKAHRPEKFRERPREAPATTVNIGIVLTPEKMREIQERHRKAMKCLVAPAPRSFAPAVEDGHAH